jgi:2,4-dienoyl-CoA reductase-like NADH-dependent reductase (Old Yellow Enzyme family)
MHRRQNDRMPSSRPPALADPLMLRCGLELPNRIVKAAMTEALADADNNPTPQLDRLYARWADSGLGMILTGNVMVDRRHLERARNVVADAATDRAALHRYAEVCRNVPTVVQLSHPGRQANRLVQPAPVGPSSGPAVGMAGLFARPRALTVAEIAELRRRFVTAARLVVDAGFDGVQVHAAHGYLLSSFLSPEVNQRQDAYGVDLFGRSRLLVEIVGDLRDALPVTAAVGVKINSRDSGGKSQQAVDGLVQVARWLDAAGADFIEVSGGNYESPALLGLDRPADGNDPGVDGADATEAYFEEAAAAVAKAVDLPVLLTGGFRTRAAMEGVLGSGAAALIGLGRPLALDPDLTRALLAGEVDELPRPAPRIGGPQRLQKLLGAAANTGWHRFQMERHGAGRSPFARLPATVAAADYVLRDGAQALLARRRRFATAARVDAGVGR